ncbi:MAG: hypothetical protein U0O22_01670 [Acutalibacteraceae bacterium]
MNIGESKRIKELYRMLNPIVAYPNGASSIKYQEYIPALLDKLLDILSVCSNGIENYSNADINTLYLELIQNIELSNDIECIHFANASLILDGTISQDIDVSYTIFDKVFQRAEQSYMFMVSSLGRLILAIGYDNPNYSHIYDAVLAIYNCLCYHIDKYSTKQYDFELFFVKHICTILYLIIKEFKRNEVVQK